MDAKVRGRAMSAAETITDRNAADVVRWLARLLAHEHEVAMGADAALRNPKNIAPPLGHRASCEVCTEVADVVPLLRGALSTAP